MSNAEALAVDAEPEAPAVFDALTEEECYLYAILSDPSGLDQAEFTWVDEESEDGCWRAWPFQWPWWRCQDKRQIDQAGRAIGKSEGLMARACAHGFVNPGAEMVITAPEGIHVDAICDRIETRLTETWLLSELVQGGRNGINHRPFKCRFKNGAVIFARIPQRTGQGVKGCVGAGTLVLTRTGLVPVEDLEAGTEVYTHEGRWRPVLHLDAYVDESPVAVKGMGTAPMVVSENHRFYVRRNEAGDKQRRRLGVPGWCGPVEAREERAYWASPAGVAGAPPAPPVGVHHRAVAQGEEFWWLVGRYLADGYLTASAGVVADDARRVRYRIHLCAVPGDQAPILDRFAALGLAATVKRRRHSSADLVEVSSTPWGRWLEEHFGRHSALKELPTFVFGLDDRDRQALLDGYLSGDGSDIPARGRVEASTASKKLAIGIKLLAQSLGYVANVSLHQPRQTHVAGVALKTAPRRSWRVHVVAQERAKSLVSGGAVWSRVAGAVEGDPCVVYNPVVAEDHSYVGDGVVCHNTHPKWLEVDEGQDYPKRGWDEIRETLRRELADSVWRIHGVSRGVPDEFQRMTQEGSGFTVHRYTQLHKPTWNPQEMADRLQEYKSKDDPNFRRNVMGEHGDAQNNIFVLARLMRCADKDPGSAYNAGEYHRQVVTFEAVEDLARRQGLPPEHYGSVLADTLEFPSAHHDARYSTYWAGMDVGISRDPTAIMVFAEYELSADERRRDEKNDIAVPAPGLTRLKLLTRLELLRIPVPDQAQALISVVEFYKPRALTLDRTGNGLGVLQVLQKQARLSRLMRIDADADQLKSADAEVVRANEALTRIKGYEFNGRIVVEIDEEKAAELPPAATIEDIADKAGIKAIAKEYATDKMRELVDMNRLMLPLDENLINQLTGQTFVYNPAQTDPYGRPTRRFSEGQFHAFDGCRMAVLGMVQEPIETFLRQKPKRRPVRDRFLG